MHAQKREPLNVNTAKFLPEKIKNKTLNISSGYFYRQDLKEIKWNKIGQILDRRCQKIDVFLFLFIDESLFFLAY